MTTAPLTDLDLTPVQRLLCEWLADAADAAGPEGPEGGDGALDFASLVEFVRSADRLAEEHSLPVRLDQALWPLLDAGWIAFERNDRPVTRWADVIPTVQLLQRTGVTARWEARPESGRLRILSLR